MTYLELAEALVVQAKAYRKTKETQSLRKKLEGQPLDAMVARAYVMPLLDQCAEIFPEPIMQALRHRLNEWAIEAVASLKRNRHMHDADDFTIFSKDVGDGLLADYINFSVRPVDYAVYAKDLMNG